MPSRLGQILRTLRESKGLTIDELAEKAGLNRDHIGRLERGEQENPRSKTVTAIAAALDISPMDILSEQFDRPKEAFEAPAYIPFDIPVVGLSKAGRGGFFDDQGYPVGEGFRKIHRPEWIKDPHAYAVLVDGDSMEPAIEEKSIVLVDTSHQVKTGDKVVARLTTGEVMLKSLRIQGDLFILESLNQKYQPIVLKKKELDWMHKVVAIKLP